MRGLPEIVDDLGQLFCVGFAGTTAPSELLEAIEKGRVAGVILFQRNIQSPEQTSDLANQLQAASRDGLPFIVSVDQEGGLVQRVKTKAWPSHEALGRGSEENTRKTAQAIGTELVAHGCNVDFAPVLDVLLEARNPIMGGRCFDRDPHLVAQHGAAFLRGLRDAGVIGCAKHFPGHGRTTLDSHLDLPVVSATAEELDRADLLPFRQVIEGGVKLLMTAHVKYPALDPEWPATLSEKIVTGLLRERLGYRGVVVTDSLEMKAVADRWSIEEIARRSVEAGCDLLLICQPEDLGRSAFEALLRAAEKDLALRERIAQSAARVRTLRRHLGAGPN